MTTTTTDAAVPRETTSPPEAASPSAYWWAGACGAAIALVIFGGMLLHGQTSLFRSEPLSNFYDLQAHSFLHLRWDVPAAPLGIEGFRIGTKTYEYFGPWPALLRLPVAALTSRFDGELTQLSMLLAFAVAMVATVRLAWRVRVLARGDEPVTRGEQVAVGAFVLLVGAGSVLLFLASRLLVFHEAEIWGVALALAAFEWVIAYSDSQRTSHLVLASALTTLAVLSRVSVGAGPLIALALLLVAGTFAAGRRLAGMPDTWTTKRNAWRLAAALAVPFVLYVYVNEAKFGTPFSVPFERQVVTFNDPAHRAMLADNNNSMIGPQFVPTVLTQYLRPDAIRFDPLFPWVRFPPPATVIGDVTFDRLDVSASVPTTMPVFLVLGIVGAVALLRRRRADRPSYALLRPAVLGALLALAPALAFGFLTQRYLADVLPLAVLTGLVGLHVLLRWSRHRERRAGVRLAWSGLVVLALLSVWWNAGFALLYQREFGYLLTNEQIASFVDLQYRIHDKFPGGTPPHVLHGRELPTQLPSRGTLFDLGRCDGLFWAAGRNQWRPLERTNRTGLYRLLVRFPELPAGARAPIVSLGSPGASVMLTARAAGPGRVQLEVQASGAQTYQVTGDPFPVRTGRPTMLKILMDHRVGELSVVSGERVVLIAPQFQEKRILSVADPVDRVAIGQGIPGTAVLPTFPGTIQSLPIQKKLCPKVVSSSR